MDLLINDLSLHGQFSSTTTFREAIHRVMQMRGLAKSYGREVYAHRNISNRLVNPQKSLHQSLQDLPREEKLATLRWLTHYGPFWEDVAIHESDIYMDFGDEIVTDTAVGEAAFCNSIGIERGLVSFAPSDWKFSPLSVRIDIDTETVVSVLNFWDIPELGAALQEAEPPVASWEQMERAARRTYQKLFFSSECFRSLAGQPFAPGVAERIFMRLGVLDELVGSVDEGGKRTAKGHQIYQDHFTGDRAWFSDSSESEKHHFEEKLTFAGPHGTPLFCTWHGKVNNPKMRIHFAWPVPPSEPVFVAYIGLKITRR